MSTLVIVLRAVSLLAFAGPMLLMVSGRGGKPKTRASQEGGDRAPVVANLAAFGLFFPSLLIFSGNSEASMALPLALSGCLLALAGAALVVRSRAELGPAWSFVPKADQGTGLVTTGPYRLVRHPIYLGLALLAMGEALAFGSWPALMIVLSGVVPTIAWRARAEEKLLSRTFGERYAVYRKQTKMIIPHLLRGTAGISLLLLTAALLPLTCTVPVRNWRTGESEDRPLPLVRGGPHVDRPSRVWIDTDAACNGVNADPDDCFAMLVLMYSPDVRCPMPISAMIGCTTSGAGHGPAVVLLHGWPQRGTVVPIHAGADRPRAPRGNRLRAVRRQQDGARGDLRSAASRARAHLPSVCAPELLEQGSRLDQVGRVESLREPRVDFRHQRVGLGRLALARP